MQTKRLTATGPDQEKKHKRKRKLSSIQQHFGCTGTTILLQSTTKHKINYTDWELMEKT
jgi:hypothetical protein